MAGISSFDQAGPASYATGGFVVASGLTTVEACLVTVKTRGANLGQVRFDTSVSAGNVTIKVMRVNADIVTAIGAVTGLDAGITLKTTSGQTYDTTTHTHGIDHNHPATAASAAPSNSGVATLAVALQPNAKLHTHTLDLPNFTATSVAETAHTHTWNNIYQHSHAITNTTTDLATAEIANATVLSATTLTLQMIGTV